MDRRIMLFAAWLFAVCLSAAAGCRPSATVPGATAHRDEPTPQSTTAREQDSEQTSREADDIEGRDYLPLVVGRVMYYDISWTPPVGEAKSATATGDVQAQVEIAGKTYFKQVTKISGIPFSPTTVIYFRRAPEGVYQVFEGDESKPEWLYLPAKIKIGDRWSATTVQGDVEFTASGIEDVETPSGTYRDCLKLSLVIKTALGKATEDQWLAPGVGSVKQVDRNPLFSSTTVLKEVSDGDDQAK
ncbi:MAG TPA: hypothetical protein VJ783_27960 [Pirellulales bacterium]|nr:hypothetical protein [Pirellulales bacterium]